MRMAAKCQSQRKLNKCFSLLMLLLSNLSVSNCGVIEVTQKKLLTASVGCILLQIFVNPHF